VTAPEAERRRHAAGMPPLKVLPARFRVCVPNGSWCIKRRIFVRYTDLDLGACLQHV